MNPTKQERTYRFRNARAEDHEAIRRLLADVELPAQDLSDASFGHFIVCLTGETLAGVVGLEPYGAAALVRSLAVSKLHRSRGIAAELLLRIEVRAEELGITKLFVLTVTAQPYSERKGFAVIDRSLIPDGVRASAQFHELCPVSARCLVKLVGAMPQTEGATATTLSGDARPHSSNRASSARKASSKPSLRPEVSNAN